ncbi:MAG: sensor histidine kinase [Clostridia bacterium]|nr:sensor histidine kinase [Clostridia bacterium]
MKISEFLKDKTLEIIFAIFLIITIIAFLSVTQVDLFIKMYIPIAILLFFIIVLTVEYIKKKKFYNAVKESLIELDEKYLIAETIENPSFLDGKLLKNILIETDKSMIEHVNKYKYLQEEYKEYIELWIHEIKTPIAAGKLIVQNNKNEVTKSIDEELDKIEYYVEQALYYARSNTVEKDYCITKCNLQDIVNTVIKKNKDDLINNKIKINIEDINENVYTDSKWIIFILNQIITNCIKYSKKENAEININVEIKKARVILDIKDNGIGIRKGEITKVFEKGFTGSNGRKEGKKSTGIGLYLCRKLCGKLGIGIELNSEENIGTDVKLVFPKNDYNLIE